MPALPYLDFGPRSAKEAAAAPVSLEVDSPVKPARSLRLQRARAAAIPKATLLDRARRKPIAIVDVQKTPEFKREKLIESDDEDDNKEEKEASPAKRESPKKKDSALERAALLRRLGANESSEEGWATAMTFGGGTFAPSMAKQGVRSAELAFLENMEGLSGEHVLKRAILHPELHKACRALSPRSMLDLQRRVRGKMAAQVEKLRAKFTRELAELDSRGVFHPDANVRRVHTRFLAAVQREVKLGDIEATCLRELLADRGKQVTIQEPPPSRPRTSEGPVTAAGLPNPAAVDRSKLLTDDQVFRQFVTWHRAKEKLDRQQLTQRGRPGPLPATESFVKSFAALGPPDFARVGEGAHVTERAHGSTREPFENSFARGNRAIDHQRDRERAAQAAHAARRALDKAAEARKIARLQEKERAKVERRKREAEDQRRVREAERRRASLESMPSLPRSRPVTRGDAPQLKRRLERVWLLLKLPMATRLAFLQKYASVEHAPRLEQAVGLWERAAEAYPRLAKLRRVEARLATGELFQAQDFVSLLRGILVKGDPAPPDVLAEPPVVDADAAAEGCDRGAAAAWLAECVETYGGRCEAAADEAEAVLGDTMPSHIDFAPPPEPPKVQRSRAGSEASLGSRA